MSEKGGFDRRLIGVLVVAVIVIAACGGFYSASATSNSSMSMSTTVMSSMTSSMGGMSTVAPLMIQQNATTADYKLQLILGPPAQMLTTSQTATATAGEVMIGGEMVSMTMGMAGVYHLEIHVYNLMSGAVVTDKNVTIQIVNDATHQTMNVPIVVMYDMIVGLSDTHFGNNVSLAPGNYAVIVSVAGETTTFNITIPT
ncbi:MAG: hypothetical protein ACLPY5_00290 [Candidatus Bathyarchaeia archaeon]